MKYSLLIFDADDTLFDFKKSERVAFEKTMQTFGFDYDENIHLPIYHEINTAIWKELDEGLITQKELKLERFRRLAAHLKSDIDVSDFAACYMKYLSHASFLFDGAYELVKELHTRCQLVLITNGLTNVQNKRIRQSIIAPFFKEITISEEIGISKPNPAIFHHALRHFSTLDPRHILMIGDNLHSDILGGKNSGIDTCWYNPADVENKTDILPTYEIHHLKELFKIIE